jgi:protein involved in polysaccharide export with SLBB domain
VLGEVNKPGSFAYSKGIKVQDVILMAGGYRDGATRKFVEVSRRIRDTLSSNASPQYATILNIDLSNKDNSNALNNELIAFDIVSIRKAPGYKEQVNVTIEGEVIYPGSYSITSNQERLSDLLIRAGGIKEGAYPEGAFMLRKVFENLTNNDSVILKNKIATLKASINDTVKAKAADSTFKGDLKIVGIRLNEVLDKKGSIYDVILQEGDIVKVPKKVETVQTFSGVYFPKKVVFRDGLSIKDIISECGGVVPGGEKKKAYVVYPNGEVRTTSNFLFFRNYPNVKPGSEVYVPVRKENKKLSTAEILGITTGLATLATMVITIANLTK